LSISVGSFSAESREGSYALVLYASIVPDKSRYRTSRTRTLLVRMRVNQALAFCRHS
jgi:hypothetical protein